MTTTADSAPSFRTGERAALWCVAAAGLLGLNGAFLYGLLRPGVMREAMANPLALAFILEALVLLPVLALLLHRWRVLRIHWGWFVALALLGSLAFALPVAVLWRAPLGRSRAH